MASALQKTTKFSDDQIIAGDNLLLTFTKIGKDIFPAATETMLNMSQALGQDVKSSAIQLGKALQDPISGVTALRRVGVMLTDEQETLIKSLVETGDAAGAQKLILKELETEFGGAAKAAGTTFAGKLEILKNQFGEVKESIGGALMPILSNMLTWFSDKMPAIQEFVTNAFATIKKTVEPLAAVILPMVRNAFNAIGNAVKFVSDNFNILGPILAGVVAGMIAYKVATIGTTIAQEAMNLITIAQALSTGGLAAAQTAMTATTGAATAAQWLLNAAMDANPIGLVVLAIAALVAIGLLLYKNWDTISAFLLKTWNSIKETAVSVWKAISDTAINIWNGIVTFFTVTIPQKFNELVTFFSELPGKIGAFLIDLFTVKIPYYIGYGIGWMVTKIGDGIASIIQFFKDLPGNIATWLAVAFENIKAWGSDMWAKAKEIGQNIVNGVIDFVKNLPSRIATWFTNMIQKIKDFVTDAKDAAGDLGKAIVDGVIDYVTALPKKIFEFFQEIIDSIGDFVSDVWDKLTGVADAASAGYKAGVAGARATGGSVLSGSSYLVGEMGPEIFTPSSSGTIIPADKTRAALNGGGTQTNQINITVPVNIGTREIRKETYTLYQQQQMINGNSLILGVT
jgi:hypothetical protein